MPRPSVPLISKHAVAQAALKVLDEDGADALTIRRLATELGVTGGAFYHHYKDKTQIVEDVTRLVLKDMELPGSDGQDWREWLVHSELGYVKALTEHPNILPLILANRPQESRRIVIEFLSRNLEREGIPASEARSVSRLIESFGLGIALVDTSDINEGATRRDPDELEDLFRAFVDMVLEKAKAKAASS
jgi:TetR/AcrR family transcriptional regulator, tetracycline repressor protein